MLTLACIRAQDAPLIFIPEEGGKQCRPAQSISSIGFLSLVVSIVNSVLMVSNNINNNNNNRNNNDNNLNDNNDNTNVGNIGSMQMNMNMVMVGRQLEQFKREKQRIKAKLLAMKKAAKLYQKQPVIPSPSDQPKPPTSESYGSWASKVRGELTEMLRDIPSNKKGGDEGAKSSSLGSLWDFRNALDKILPPPLQQRQSRSSWDCARHVNHISTDAIYIGLSFVDFWFTATSGVTEVACLQHEFCQLANETDDMIGDHKVLRVIVDRLSQGASFYLSQFHRIPKLYYRKGDCESAIRRCQ